MTIKRRFVLENPFNEAELIQFYKEEWAKIPPQWLKDSLSFTANAWLQVLLFRVTQPVISFRGKLLYLLGATNYPNLHDPMMWPEVLKTTFCVYLDYLCLIFKSVWWSETFKCAKHEKSGRGQILSYTYINTAKWNKSTNEVLCVCVCVWYLHVALPLLSQLSPIKLKVPNVFCCTSVISSIKFAQELKRDVSV